MSGEIEQKRERLRKWPEGSMMKKKVDLDFTMEAVFRLARQLRQASTVNQVMDQWQWFKSTIPDGI